ncbi:hypothetical protein MUY14_09410 [Amycolatopsis sp. FBCC-B4732]|uniref:GH25 family lysozyme n=1 Tax=Amycolatopsis sp. FBCC-B4732 TaxID=3079339 RepID=UPI001FF1EAA5|nr:GH25 family lysozyme [Amycolatopsis sp. FBCC-B4732]UOX90822.1 hypothetical protein MUY14_09410 [Amycolatopsis sp. FBCC-B4732]
MVLRALVVVPALAVGMLLCTVPAQANSTPAHPESDFMGSMVHRVEGHSSARATTRAAAAAATPNAAGMDVSHWQNSVDWTTAATNGATFAYMKATEGTTYVDDRFAANYAGSANAGLMRGAYHFALPDTASGAAQATFFLAQGGGWVADGHTLPPVLDIEYNPYGTADWAGWCYGLTPAQLTAWITDFTTTVHDRTNRWPAIYTTNGWWANCTGGDTGTAANSPLWIAHNGTDPGTIPGGWSAYTFWQYADSGTFPGDQDYFGGTADQVRAVALGSGPDKIAEHYAALGGAASYLGTPVGGETPVAGGWEQKYTGGVIDYAPNTGAFAVHGDILTAYQRLGGPAGALGFPVADETTTSDGAGRYSDFVIGSIYTTPGTGAHGIQGEIRKKWRALGAEKGLGYPTTDETSTPDGVARYNHFSTNASIYYTVGTGAHNVQGEIRKKWAALGWERGLGYPTTDESSTPDGVARYNHFTTGSSIYYTVNTGAHSIQGEIRKKWAALGWERGLGYPTTDESSTPDGVGRYNHFTNSASVYWTASTGAWSIHGAIRDKWASLGWERSALAYPTSDEYGVSVGRRNDFQHGGVTYNTSTGATTVTYS